MPEDTPLVIDLLDAAQALRTNRRPQLLLEGEVDEIAELANRLDAHAARNRAALRPLTVGDLDLPLHPDWEARVDELTRLQAEAIDRGEDPTQVRLPDGWGPQQAIEETIETTTTTDVDLDEGLILGPDDVLLVVCDSQVQSDHNFIGHLHDILAQLLGWDRFAIIDAPAAVGLRLIGIERARAEQLAAHVAGDDDMVDRTLPEGTQGLD